jgi:hypothetical protein
VICEYGSIKILIDERVRRLDSKLSMSSTQHAQRVLVGWKRKAEDMRLIEFSFHSFQPDQKMHESAISMLYVCQLDCMCLT